jgi:hypothetical protein
MKIFLCVLLLSSLSFYVQGNNFTDSFEGRSLKKEWKATDGHWRIGPRKTLQQIIGGPNRLGRIELNIPMVDSIDIQAKISYFGGKKDKNYGAGFQFFVPEKNGTFYEIKFGTVGCNEVSISRVTVEFKGNKCINRYKVLKKCVTPLFELNKIYSVRITCKNGNICISMDDEEIIDYSDSIKPFPKKGKTVLFTYGAAADFDDVCIGNLK